MPEISSLKSWLTLEIILKPFSVASMLWEGATAEIQ